MPGRDMVVTAAGAVHTTSRTVPSLCRFNEIMEMIIAQPDGVGLEPFYSLGYRMRDVTLGWMNYGRDYFLSFVSTISTEMSELSLSKLNVASGIRSFNIDTIVVSEFTEASTLRLLMSSGGGFPWIIYFIL
jgi:hypothetical protein